MLRHEGQTVAMELAAALHHSRDAGPGTCAGLRSQKTASSGLRPGVLTEQQGGGSHGRLRLGMFLSASVLPLAFIPSCAALILPFHGARSRRATCSFQLEVFQYLSDVSLIRLECEAATIPFNDAIQYSSALLKVRVFPNHFLLHLVLS